MRYFLQLATAAMIGAWMLTAMPNVATAQDGAARVIGVSEGGNRVLQMLSNYQHLEEGGSGYLRLIVCDPSKDTVSVSTYSPHLDAYLTDADNQFTVGGVSLGPVPRAS